MFQLIEREGFVEIWVIDPPEKINIFKLSRQYFQTDPKLVELPSGWGEGELAWRGGAEAASRKPVCNLEPAGTVATDRWTKTMMLDDA